MRVFGLIGFPLTHSFSKKYFTGKFEKEGITDSTYDNWPLASLDELKDVLRKKGLAGFSITIPYKEQILNFLHERTETVSKVKACNCVKVNNGRLIGYNTDITGFEGALKESQDPSIHKKALILGTGGAAKAVEYVLRKLGISYRHVSRKPSARNYSYEQLVPEVVKEHTLIINTTPLGMFPNTTQAPDLPYEALGSSHFLFDLIYNPAKTLFLKKGEEQGAQVANGLRMLEIQAEENWRIWNS